VTQAPSGEAEIQLLRRDFGFPITTSDMRMPGMNGASFLAEARVLAPLSVRMLLTPHSDLVAAGAAITKARERRDPGRNPRHRPPHRRRELSALASVTAAERVPSPRVQAR